MAPIGSVLLAPSPAAGTKYDLTYYVKAAAAGGICCSITHGALTPVDGTSLSMIAAQLPVDQTPFNVTDYPIFWFY